MSIQVDWQTFTPISLVGGLMLGVATVILLLGIGRIAGISGIFSSLLKPKRVEMWQILFIVGLIASPFSIVWSDHFLMWKSVPPYHY